MKKRILSVVVIIVLLSIVAAGAYYYLRYEAQITFFDKSGWFVSEDNKTYYLDYFGQPLMLWQELDGKLYYFDPEQNGALATGWLSKGNCLFYLNQDGVQQSGFLNVDGTLYYLDVDGKRYSGWTSIGGLDYYLNEDGKVSKGWIELEEGTFYLSESGAKVTGKAELDQKEYYFDPLGRLFTGWLEEGNITCYYDKEGLRKGWLQLEEGTYYLNDSGAKVRGWYSVDQEWYYFDDEGIMITGWFSQEDELYYFQEDGTMAVGQVNIDGIERFFDSRGRSFYLVNRNYPVPEDAVPDLVDVEGFMVDSSCASSLISMITDCRLAGYGCVINSAYRSYDFQNQLFVARKNTYISEGYSAHKATELAATRVLPPGTSEHQLGLAVDIVGTEAMYAWLLKNAPNYGFILRYPENKIDVTGIIYEPWHFRYVGLDLAAEVTQLELTLEEYIVMLTNKN